MYRILSKVLVPSYESSAILFSLTCSWVSTINAYNLIDVGCGEGYYSRKIKELFQADIVAFDISKDAALKKFLSVMLPIALCQIAFELEEITYAVLFNKVLAFVAYPEDVRIEMFGIYTGQYRVIINILLALLMCIAMVKAPELKKLHKKKKIEELNTKAEWIFLKQ